MYFIQLDECINGSSFIELTQDDLKTMTIKMGPAKEILKIIKNLTVVLDDKIVSYRLLFYIPIVFKYYLVIQNIFVNFIYVLFFLEFINTFSN